MAFKRPLPEWNNPGVEPPQSKKDMGWLGREKPPAQWHNWFQHLVFKALEELQQGAAHVTFGVTAPTSPDVNDLWVDTSGSPVLVLKAWNGAQWITVGAVNSVNGKTGDIELTAEDVGAASMTAFNAHLNDKLQNGVHGLATTQDMTLYVDGTNGDDSNDGLTPQTAFKTIQRAVDSVPLVINHTVKIKIADGVYNEDVLISGFIGKDDTRVQYTGKRYGLILEGNETNNTAVKIFRISISNNKCIVFVQNLEVIGGKSGFDYTIHISNGSATHLRNVVIKEPNQSRGIVVSFGDARIEQCEISNKLYGIVAFNGARVHSYNNTGSGNTYALFASEGSLIAKNGTQPTGTQNEDAASGSLILEGRAAAIVDMSTNANGTYVRWSNGLQICWHRFGDLFSPGETKAWDWVFPASFSGVLPFKVCGPGGASDNVELFAAGFNHATAQNTTSKTRVVIKSLHDGQATIAIEVMAIGRWK